MEWDEITEMGTFVETLIYKHTYICRRLSYQRIDILGTFINTHPLCFIEEMHSTFTVLQKIVCSILSIFPKKDKVSYGKFYNFFKYGD